MRKSLAIFSILLLPFLFSCVEGESEISSLSSLESISSSESEIISSSSSEKEVSSSIEVTSSEEKKQMETYNSYIEGYSSLSLNVRTTFGSETLQGDYKVENKSSSYFVSYKYEQFAQIMVGGTPIVYKEGSYVWKDSIISEEKGDKSNVPFEMISLFNFKFVDSLITDYQINSSGVVLANITDFASFLHVSGTYSNAFLNLYVKDEKADKLLFSYNKGESQVVLTYTFTF